MLLAAIAALAGAAVQSATGFGFALVLSPALFAAMDPVEAVTALLVLGLVLNLLVLFEGGRPEHVDWRALAPMLLAALPGLAAGAFALTRLSKEALQVAVGIAVIVAAAWQLRQRRRVSPAEGPASDTAAQPSSAAGRRPHLPPAAGLAVGFASGALTTSISVSGPPIVLWLEARGVRPEEFRATLAASFLALNLAGGAVLLGAEGTGALDAAAVAPLLALVAAGYALGALAFRRLDRERFFVLVLVLVACTGAASVAAGLVG
ncbi:MAG: sulfite exporter TauE/SafE family protein [Thermoleophilaceae bacterium]